jgi:hypothetical protein
MKPTEDTATYGVAAGFVLLLFILTTITGSSAPAVAKTNQCRSNPNTLNTRTFADRTQDVSADSAHHHTVGAETETAKTTFGNVSTAPQPANIDRSYRFVPKAQAKTKDQSAKNASSSDEAGLIAVAKRVKKAKKEALRKTRRSRRRQITALRRLYEKAPIMKKIAWCESRDRQFDKSGKPLIGFSGADKGRFQINQVHWERARRMGINLNTVQGNARYAEHLYETKGTKPWYKSRHCWTRSQA